MLCAQGSSGNEALDEGTKGRLVTGGSVGCHQGSRVLMQGSSRELSWGRRWKLRAAAVPALHGRAGGGDGRQSMAAGARECGGGGGGGCWNENECPPIPLSHFIRSRRVAEEPLS